MRQEVLNLLGSDLALDRSHVCVREGLVRRPGEDLGPSCCALGLGLEPADTPSSPQRLTSYKMPCREQTTHLLQTDIRGAFNVQHGPSHVKIRLILDLSQQ